jgi:hypothetical protein
MANTDDKSADGLPAWMIGGNSRILIPVAVYLALMALVTLFGMSNYIGFTSDLMYWIAILTFVYMFFIDPETDSMTLLDQAKLSFAFAFVISVVSFVLWLVVKSKAEFEKNGVTPNPGMLFTLFAIAFVEVLVETLVGVFLMVNMRKSFASMKKQAESAKKTGEDAKKPNV